MILFKKDLAIIFAEMPVQKSSNVVEFSFAETCTSILAKSNQSSQFLKILQALTSLRYLALVIYSCETFAPLSSQLKAYQKTEFKFDLFRLDYCVRYFFSSASNFVDSTTLLYQLVCSCAKSSTQLFLPLVFISGINATRKTRWRWSQTSVCFLAWNYFSTEFNPANLPSLILRTVSLQQCHQDLQDLPSSIAFAL